MEQERITIELKTKIVVLLLEPIDFDLDLKELTDIHYYNIIGEMITCSTLLNRMGVFLADTEELVKEAKLDFEIFEAQMFEEKRKELTFPVTDAKGNTKYDKPSLPEINAAIVRSPKYKVKKLNIFKLEKNHEYVKSTYWAVQNKCKLIERFSDKLKPEDFEKDIVEERINTVMIKVYDKVIK